MNFINTFEHKFDEMIKIATIHAKRVQMALDHLGPLFPLSTQSIDPMEDKILLFTELLLSRFSKLQDFIGSKLIDAFLTTQGELIQGCSMIDKINKLEKMGIQIDTPLWLQMREIRNHLAHEYPSHPQITVHYLNTLFDLAPKLLAFLESLILQKQSKKNKYLK